MKSSWSEQVGIRRSIVLILSRQQRFPDTGHQKFYNIGAWMGSSLLSFEVLIHFNMDLFRIERNFQAKTGAVLLVVCDPSMNEM
jgi:hypothetical protein